MFSITYENKEQLENLLNLIDLAVKAGGLNTAKAATFHADKIISALNVSPQDSTEEE